MAESKARGESELLAALADIAGAGALPGAVLARLANAVAALCHANTVEFSQLRRRLRRQSAAIEELRSQLEQEKKARISQDATIERRREAAADFPRASAAADIATAFPASNIELRRVADADFPRVAPPRKNPFAKPPPAKSSAARSPAARGGLNWCDSHGEWSAGSARPRSGRRVSRRLTPRSRSRKRRAPGERSPRARAGESDEAKPSSTHYPPRSAHAPQASLASPGGLAASPRTGGGRSSPKRPPSKRRKPLEASVDHPFLTRPRAHDLRAMGAAPTQSTPARPAIAVSSSLRPLPTLDDVRGSARLRRTSARAQMLLRDRDNRPPCAECCKAQRKLLTDAHGRVKEDVYARFVKRPGGCHHFRHLDDPVKSEERDARRDVSFPETETEAPEGAEEEEEMEENSP